MRRIILATIIMLMTFLGTAGATTVIYDPSVIALSVPAGTSVDVIYTVSLMNPKGTTYSVSPFSSFASESLPREWLSTTSSMIFLGRDAVGRISLFVSVPPGTPSGVYSGTVFARAMASHDIADAGTGLRVEITVPSVCSGVPVFEAVAVDPLVLWPPNHKLQRVTVTGTAVVPPGCGLAEVGYLIEDEYGTCSGMGSVAAEAGGAFTIVLPLEASREGRDKDGRHYRITLFAVDEAGTATGGPFEVLVPHDQGEQQEKN